MVIARILLILTTVIWGSTFVATKVCLKYMTPIEVMAFRFTIALPLIFGLMKAGRIRFFLGRHKARLGWASLVLLAHFLVQITGIKYTTATNTGWIIALTPLVVAVLAATLLHERLTYKIILGIGIATAGIILLVSRGKLTDLRWLSSYGDWLVLASAHTWAIYTILTRDVSRDLNPLVVTSVILLPSALISLLGVGLFSQWSRFLHLPLEAVISIIFLGILGTALGHWFWQLGVARIGASRAGIFLYLEPIATTIVAVPYLGEPLGVITIIGGLAVLLGVWISQR
jgi:drug/metabolite transporter (DMT)-like permease